MLEFIIQLGFGASQKQFNPKLHPYVTRYHLNTVDLYVRLVLILGLLDKSAHTKHPFTFSSVWPLFIVHCNVLLFYYPVSLRRWSCFESVFSQAFFMSPIFFPLYWLTHWGPKSPSRFLETHFITIIYVYC